MSQQQTGDSFWRRIVVDGSFFSSLSLFLFFSGLFAIFSSIPILVLFFKRGRAYAYLASAFILLLVVFISRDPLSIAGYCVFGVIHGLCLSECLDRKKTLEKSALLTLLSMMAVLLQLGLVYSMIYHQSLVREVTLQISSFIDYFVKVILSRDSSLSAIGITDALPIDVTRPEIVEEWKKNLLLEFPSGIAMVMLIAIWFNLLAFFRFVPASIQGKIGFNEDSLRIWKAPDFLVWPTLFFGFLVVIPVSFPWVSVVSGIAVGFFKFFMAIYAIQGFSILGFLLNHWKIRSGFRWACFLATFLFMMPLVLSFGFFDLWFDFRSRFRQR